MFFDNRQSLFVITLSFIFFACGNHKDPSKDLPPHPDLNQVGSLLLEPVLAPHFELTDSDGKMASLNDYRGKTLVLVFYIDGNCMHCKEQLKALASLYGEFLKSGIEIIAISTENISTLKNKLSEFAQDKDGFVFPFRFFADPELKIFKAYKVYDDVKRKPDNPKAAVALHGTFLIDAAGKIRWQDIGPQPFDKVQFLLEGSRRLLKL